MYLMSVYDKADFSTVDLSVLKEIVKISSEGLLRHTALSFKHKITTKTPLPDSANACSVSTSGMMAHNGTGKGVSARQFPAR